MALHPALAVRSTVPACLQTSKRLAEERRKAEEGVQRRKQEEQARGNVERLRQLQEQWRTNATMQKVSAAPGFFGILSVNPRLYV